MRKLFQAAMLAASAWFFVIGPSGGSVSVVGPFNSREQCIYAKEAIQRVDQSQHVQHDCWQADYR